MANTSRLRRFLDTGDLVLSVFGDPWHDVATTRLESAEHFRTVAARRLHGRADSAARRLAAAEGADHAAGLPPGALREEERARLILALLRLHEGERDVLRLHLKGLPLPDIARRLGLPAEEARHTLADAIAHARRLSLAHETCTAPTCA
jgi:RNA polymerase sigma factor (sigma-70 family)